MTRLTSIALATGLSSRHCSPALKLRSMKYALLKQGALKASQCSSTPPFYKSNQATPVHFCGH